MRDREDRDYFEMVPNTIIDKEMREREIDRENDREMIERMTEGYGESER